MPALLLLAFLVFPLVEIWALIQVGSAIGVWWTIALLVVDSIVGAWLMRHEGRRAWMAFREALAAGRWPADEVAQGALVLVGGALLLTPGFVTDIVGFAFLLPPTRALLARLIRRRLAAGSIRVIGVGPPSSRGRSHRSATGSRDVLDVEVVSVERMSEPTVERMSEPGSERMSEPGNEPGSERDG